MANRGSFEICALAHEAPAVILAWVAHHLSIGAAQISLFLDRATPEVSKALAQHDRVSVTVCNGEYWSKAVGSRPVRVEARQRKVLQSRLEASDCDWLILLAVDEFLDPPSELALTLAGQSDVTDFIKLPVRERVHLSAPDPENLFAGVFRLPHKVIHQAAADKADGIAAPYLSQGMAAHVPVRSFLRTKRNLVAGPNGPAPSGTLKEGQAPDTRLLHYDGMTPDHWVAKRLRSFMHASDGAHRAMPSRRAQLAELGALKGAARDPASLYTRVLCLSEDRAAALRKLGLLDEVAFDPKPALAREFPDFTGKLTASEVDSFDILPKGTLPPLPKPPTQQVLQPRSIDELPRISQAEIASHPKDCLYLPPLGGPTELGWLDPIGAPYLLILHNAVYYPKGTLNTAIDPVALPARKQRKDLGLLVASDNALYPDSFGKGRFIPGALGSEPDGTWAAGLPEPEETLAGTHLFAELVYAHFGHCLVDMPSRLWPLAEGSVSMDTLDGVVAMGMLGVGPGGRRMPSFATQLLEAYGVPREKLRVVDRPVLIERLIVPRRIAPYIGLMHPVFSELMAQAGERLAKEADPADHPKRIYLSRGKLADDPRSGGDSAALEALFSRHGFEIRHPQTMTLADQVAMAQNATHFAGPIGSQLHLCGFARQAGARVFTLSPAHFRVEINKTLLHRVGGTETDFCVASDPPKGPAHRAKWSVPEADMPRLEAAVEAWLAED